MGVAKSIYSDEEIFFGLVSLHSNRQLIYHLLNRHFYYFQASDYQKPFNEASEKLLKSLLEKRKKLNPSYLRVMARYVGLGLLKSPKN